MFCVVQVGFVITNIFMLSLYNLDTIKSIGDLSKEYDVEDLELTSVLKYIHDSSKITSIFGGTIVRQTRIMAVLVAWYEFIAICILVSDARCNATGLLKLGTRTRGTYNLFGKRNVFDFSHTGSRFDSSSFW